MISKELLDNATVINKPKSKLSPKIYTFNTNNTSWFYQIDSILACAVSEVVMIATTSPSIRIYELSCRMAKPHILD